MEELGSPKFGLFIVPLSKGGLGGDLPLAVQNIALFYLKNGRLKINFSKKVEFDLFSPSYVT
jgi:hypothetical protein